MKIFGEKVIETVVDCVCDVCGKSLFIDVDGEKCEEAGELKAQWGYGSKEDGIAYHLDLCEDCFKVALLTLKDHRRNLVLFDESQDLPDENFGIDEFRTLQIESGLKKKGAAKCILKHVQGNPSVTDEESRDSGL